MATVWSVAPYFPRAEYLLQDGNVVQAPPVETTSSNRRWRIQGTTMSVVRGEIGDKIADHVRMRAHSMGTDLWMKLCSDEQDLKEHYSHATTGAGVAESGNSAYLDAPVPWVSQRGKNVPVAFEFKHPTYPLRAILWVIFTVNYNHSLQVSTLVTCRGGDPREPNTLARLAWTPRTARRYDKPVAADAPTVAGLTIEKVQFTHTRKAVSYFLELLLKAQDIDTVELPDRRLHGGTLTYEFSRTNYSQDLYRELVDKVQEGPALARLADALKVVRQELSTLGVVNGAFDAEDILNGNLHEIRLNIMPHEDEDLTVGGIDPTHNLVIDLAKGICFVECSAKNLEDVAEQWNVAKFKAELTGQVDELLAYAEAYNMASEQKRLRKIIKQRALDGGKKK